LYFLFFSLPIRFTRVHFLIKFTEETDVKTMTNRKCFKEIVQGLEDKHSTTLMDRARTANRLAKQSRGASRRNAYTVKHRALAGLVEKFPDRSYIRKDARLPEFRVVGLSTADSGLHIPASLVQI
jgi:hypothetical protein